MRIQLRVYIKEWNTYKTYLTCDDVKNFINANRREEIIFTKGTTESMNMIIFGFMKNYLKPGDEVLITKTEHASNVLPWFTLENKMGIKVKYIPLDNYEVTLDKPGDFYEFNVDIVNAGSITGKLNL